MAKITRVSAKIFGASAGADQIKQFGSLSAGTPLSSTDPATIQALSNWLTGWYGAVIGGNSPAIEDVNAMSYVFAYQLAYLMQAGVAEWDSGTTYYIGSLVNDGTGVVYVSITNANLNNAVSDVVNWKRQLLAPTVQKFTSGSGTYTKPAGVLYLKVSLVAGGGGGAAGGSAVGGATAGSNGVATTFGSSLLSGSAGGGGFVSSINTGGAGGVSGAASLGSGPVGLAFQSSYGLNGETTAAGTAVGIGGAGGNSPLGGGGPGGTSSGGGNALGYGSGGGGGYAPSGNYGGGGGGGAGGYVSALIVSPVAASYSYSVGAGGAGGSGGGGGAGGSGSAGVILVEEYYN